MSTRIRAGDFALIEGEERWARVIGEAWDVLAGVGTTHTLERLIMADKVHGRRYFINDNYWWQYTDAQCTFEGTYGWRPFFDPAYRTVDHDTWNRFFECQVGAKLFTLFKSQSSFGKSPPIGFFPHSVFPEKEAGEQLPFFYSNSFAPGDEAHEKHDEQIDYMLMNIITASDWVLLERNMEVGKRILRQVEAFMKALEARMDPDGLLPVGPQGTQIEFAHGGTRYPASTHVYLVKACRSMAEVAAMVEGSRGEEPRVDGSRGAAKKRGPSRAAWEKRASRAAAHLQAFVQSGKWFVSALDSSRKNRLGTGLVDATPSSYFESFPNLNAIVLGVAGDTLASTILDRMEEIPQLTKNTLVLVCYPERPRAEMDNDHEGFPPPGTHVNGGAWWQLASSMLYAVTACGRPGALEYLQRLLHFQQEHLTIDGYNNWGEDPASQFSDKGNGKPDHYSIGSSGSLGMFFRGTLGTVPRGDGLAVTTRLPAGIRSMKTLAPVYYGGKRLFFEIAGRGGEKAERFLSFADLASEATIAI